MKIELNLPDDFNTFNHDQFCPQPTMSANVNVEVSLLLK